MGNGKLTLTDEREGSPSFGERVEIVLNENEPKSVLIPFGLKYRFLAEQESKIIIVRTNQERS